MRSATRLLVSIATAAALFTAGCNTTSIGISSYENPPPELAFSAYKAFELQPLQMDPPYSGQSGNEKAKAKIQEGIDLKLQPLVDQWNAQPPAATAEHGTLLIEPHIHEIKFIGGAARFWAGAMAGDSAVVVRVVFRDKDTGQLVAEPEFYQHANAHGGAWSVGGTDNAMLHRIATLIAEYAERNYTTPVGGETGKPRPK